MATRTRVSARPAIPDKSGSGLSRIEDASRPSRVREDFALTFDDVLLVPRHSQAHPRDVSVVSRFTRGIDLRIPLVSAAMDTVTESEMAIAIARAGGIGVLHKNMSIDRQAAEVDRVKRSESGMILKPITLRPTDTVREATALMHRFRISGVPIVDDEERLVGIITNRDLQFERNLDRPLSEAMTSDGLITAREGTTLDEAEQILGRNRIEKLPVVDGTGVLKGLITIKDIHKRRQYPDANKDKFGRLRVAAAIGAGGDFLVRARALI
jgi:IMP dehydrogenase